MVSIAKLRAIAQSVAPPSYNDDWIGDVEFPAGGGWTVVFFYDCGALDYLSHFITPAGETIDFWEWPAETPGREQLINWC